MRFLFILIGTLLFTQEAAALTAPARPVVISTKYVEGVFTHIETFLGAMSGAASASCTSSEATQSEAEAARNLRRIFFDVQAAVGESARDLERSACFVSDIEALETYLRDLFDLALSSAQSCDTTAQGHYETAIAYVWSKLYSLRRLGLDPTVQAPISGEEVTTIGSSHLDDDLLCPYHSAYALPVFDSGAGSIGCTTLPGTSSLSLQREMQIIQSILQTSAKIRNALPLLSATVARILTSAAAFVNDTQGVLPFPPTPPNPLAPAPVVFINAGEAGCLDWPSDVGGLVSGEDAPLQNFFPMVLTRDLAEVMAFLKEREKDSWFEYIVDIDRQIAEGETEGGNFYAGYLTNLRKVNREHIGVESFSILSIRDPQKRMERAANFLHEGTREFTRLAVAMPGDPPLPDGPPLRAFALKYASFLSRMCVNRGCADRLKRTVELSLRDECFSSFLMHLFFQGSPTSSTLPACRALYAE